MTAKTTNAEVFDIGKFTEQDASLLAGQNASWNILFYITTDEARGTQSSGLKLKSYAGRFEVGAENFKQRTE
jgi:hypothetical protein